MKKVKLRKYAIKIGSGITPKGGESSYKAFGIPLIRSQNVLENKLSLENVAFIDAAQHKKMSGSKVNPGDVLLNITGASIGRSCVVPQEVVEANVNQHVCVIRLKRDYYAPFLSSFLNSWFGQKQVFSFQGGGSREGLNYQQIASFDIPSLQYSEQKTIADLLSTWDEAIEKTTRLIQAKEKRFSQISKWLLFGHKRLRKQKNELVKGLFYDYPSDWKLAKIGTVAQEITERNGVSDATVLSCSKYEGFVNSLDYFGKQVFSSDISNYKVVKRGQFGYPSNHVEEGSIGLLEHCEIGIVSPIYIVFEASKEKVHSPYLYKLLKTDTYRHIFQVSTSSSVDRRGSLRWPDFSKIKVLLPPVDEQHQISDAINAFQREIRLLRRLVEKYKTQKRGLMQKILTGQWRIKPEIVKKFSEDMHDG